MEAKPAAEMAGDGFTEADLEAADNLVQLSVSGGGEEDDRAEASSSSRTSTLSVNKAAEAVAGEQAGDDDETGLDTRVRKRYRLLAELYAATLPVKDGGRKRKKSERMGLQQRKL